MNSPKMPRTALQVALAALLSLTFSMVVESAPYDLEFCSFLGGSHWERVQAVSVDDEGFIYVAGSTKSADFPATPGALDNTGSGNGSNDGFLARISPDGSRIIWATYLHGTSRDDVYGVHVDDQGFVYAVGWTRSSDFPTTAGAHDRTHNGDMDVFLAKLSPEGDSLVFSTFLGGSGIDQCRGGMDLDAEGGVYLCGYTDSTDFPATEGAIQKSFQGGYGDAFMAKLSADGSTLHFATYLGSSGPDHAFPGLRLHSDGSIFMTGVAGAADFPTTPGSFQEDFGGTEVSGVWYGDAFVARFSLTETNGHTLHYVTFLGGSGMEKSTAQHGIALAEDGEAVIAITSHSSDFPTTAEAYQGDLRGNNNVCIARLSLDGSRLVAATYLGGAPEGGYEPNGLALDAAGNVYLTGSIFGSITNHPVTADAYRDSAAGDGEAFFAVLPADLSSLRYGSCFGGNDRDRIRDLARTSGGDLIFAGDTYSTDLPASTDAFQKTYSGDGDAYVVRFSEGAQAFFQRGDANADGSLDVSDAVSILSHLFLGLPSGLDCDKSADADDRGSIEITDAVYILGFLFLGSNPPPLPFPDCGADPTTDDLECALFDPC